MLSFLHILLNLDVGLVTLMDSLFNQPINAAVRAIFKLFEEEKRVGKVEIKCSNCYTLENSVGRGRERGCLKLSKKKH